MALLRVKVKTINPKKDAFQQQKNIFSNFLKNIKNLSCFVVILYYSNNKNCNCMQNLLFSRKCNASIDN